MNTKKIIALTTLILTAFYTHADNKSKADKANYQQTTHVHGLGELNLVGEHNSIEISFHSPAISLLGFEHKAKNKKQKKALIHSQKILKDTKNIFVFTGGNCQIKKIDVKFSGALEEKHHEHHHKHSEHDEHEKSHKQHHKHDKHNGHDEHSEVNANYLFECNTASKISSISIKLFEQFPGIHAISAAWITEKKQGGKKLSIKDNVIKLN